jgi:hypothetical protein
MRGAETIAESDSLAREAAHRATSLVARVEANDADSAEFDLKARHVLCQTIARHLSLKTAVGDAIGDDVHEATVVVDDGLGLVRQWEQKGIARFRGPTHDLFYSARWCTNNTSRSFLAFIAENTESSPSSPDYVESVEIRSAALNALALSTRHND